MTFQDNEAGLVSRDGDNQLDVSVSLQQGRLPPPLVSLPTHDVASDSQCVCVCVCVCGVRLGGEVVYLVDVHKLHTKQSGLHVIFPRLFGTGTYLTEVG